jgi:hypothetical protein
MRQGSGGGGRRSEDGGLPGRGAGIAKESRGGRCPDRQPQQSDQDARDDVGEPVRSQVDAAEPDGRRESSAKDESGRSRDGVAGQVKDDDGGCAEERRRRRRVRARKTVTVFRFERGPEIRAPAAEGPFDDRTQRPATENRSTEEGRQNPPSPEKEGGSRGEGGRNEKALAPEKADAPEKAIPFRSVQGGNRERRLSIETHEGVPEIPGTGTVRLPRRALQSPQPVQTPYSKGSCPLRRPPTPGRPEADDSLRNSP